MTASDRKCTFTVFTATYNRAHTLSRVYDSLDRQTFKDFEWLIVDDGSNDGTAFLVERWQRETWFPIRYIYQENAGKHVAFNRGIQEALGELFLTLDSDDACVPEALERFKFHWDSIPLDRRSAFSAVTCLCMDQHGELVGDPFPRDVLDSDSIELMYKYKVCGEKWGFHRTAVLEEYPFPQPAGVKFVPESIAWLAIARDYKTRFVNERLRIYHVDDGAGDKLSTLTNRVAQGRLLFHKVIIDDFNDVPGISAAGRLASLANYSRYSFWCGIGPLSQFRGVSSYRARALLPLVVPVGYAFFLRDRWYAACSNGGLSTRRRAAR